MSSASWTDDPLSSGESDTLNRQPYARRAAQLILQTHSFDSSVVFGLSGPWGSGKTSLLNMITEELTAEAGHWAVARFTPWATSDASGMLEEFYTSLVQALPAKKSKHVKRALGLVAQVTAPAAALIPYAGQSAAELSRMAAAALTTKPSWPEAFTEASNRLKTLRLPILMVVDDIDRLQAEELLILLKVVRLLGRFPGVQYILAYDDETLLRALSTTRDAADQDGSAERYMEKIVQYPLVVPPLLRHQQIQRLNEGLTSLARHADADNGQRRIGGLLDFFVELLRTPRAIDRYLAQLRHHLPMIPPEEVDDEDVMILTLLRVSFPNLVTRLPEFKSQLLTGHTGEPNFSARPSIEYERFDLGQLLESAPARHREAAKRLLVALFPKTKSDRTIVTYGSSTRRGIALEEYFDRYMAMGIPDHDVSDATVTLAVTKACQGEPRELRQLLNSDPDKQLLVLGKARSTDNQPNTDDGRLTLAATLTDAANAMPDEDGSPFSTQQQTMNWIADVVTPLSNGIPASSVLDLLNRLERLDLKLRLWIETQHTIDRQQRPLPAWYAGVQNNLISEATTAVLDHLRSGDDAPTHLPIGYPMHFVLDAGGGDHLRQEINALLDARSIDISILASRVVSASTIVGITPDWQLSSDVRQDTFNQIAPDRDDPWYSLPAEPDLNLRDLSWANRRRFAAGRVKRPGTT